MRLDIGDILILLGAIIFLGGLYLFDWRLSVVFGGGLLIGAGIYRLRQAAVNDYEGRRE